MKRNQVEALREVQQTAAAQESGCTLLEEMLANNPHLPLQERKRLKEISNLMSNTSKLLKADSKKLTSECGVRTEQRIHNFNARKARVEGAGTAQKSLLPATGISSGVSPEKKKKKNGSDDQASAQLDHVMAFNREKSAAASTSAASTAKARPIRAASAKNKTQHRTPTAARDGKAGAGSPLDFIAKPKNGTNTARLRLRKFWQTTRSYHPKRTNPQRMKLL